MNNVRYPAVADMFYPADPMELAHTINNLVSYAKEVSHIPKAIITPHAGYIYSGEIAANAFAALIKVAKQIRRVVIMGPAHHYPFRGVAASSADYFLTPLGKIELDQDAIAKIIGLPRVTISDEAHLYEHSIEVQLPFLQVLLSDFKLIPLLANTSPIEYITQVLDALWGGDETLIIVSSDLSHYHPYAEAQTMDKQVAQAILDGKIEAIKDENACGALPIRALVQIAKQKNLQAKLIDLRNSGDTAGTKDKVVGYGAFHFV
jgi:AmmeMemoRadiSam system protein B